MRVPVSMRVAVLATASAMLGMTLAVTARQSSDPFTSLSFREVGPTRQGGRFVDFAVVEATPRIFYAASASGGVYKTESNGVSFAQVFDNGGTASVGAIAVSQSNPDVLYLGTGEGNNSRTMYYGDGVYKSTDAGKSWTNVGLKDSQHIGRIVVHPTDPNTAYVAAAGHLYSENEERGLYKTVDGGKTWTKSLDLKNAAGKAVGVVDVAMDPKNPLVLYAAAYEKVRKPYSFAPGGPASGLYKTMDGGKTWTRLAGGLPAGPLGRIGIAISRQDPNTVYAIVEVVNAADDAAKQRLTEGFGDTLNDPTFRSDDAGRTWRQVAPPVAPAGAGAAAPAGRGRNGGYPANDTPYYYSNIRVDPNDKNHIFVLNTGAAQSPDGGTTWQPLGAGGDNHALWIDPKDSKHMLLGYDHGMSITFDGGAHWTHPDNLATAQCMGIGFDMAQPYNVYCGLQDNGSKKGPSTMKGGGPIPFEAWTNTGGGDGQQNIVDLQTSRYLYNESQFGAMARTDMWTGETKGMGGAGRGSGAGQFDGKDIRWNWNAPIVVSPHNGDTVYSAGSMVLKSVDRGETWDAISGDLTVNDPSTRGGTGNISYGTITALDESPIVPGVLWAGTDDGNVQVTKDGGKTWTNVRDKIPGHPGYWVSRVEPSHLSAGTAYVSVTGLRNDDFRPFVWKTTDYGQTWTSLAANLPNESVNTIREDPYNADLLFVGTDLGLYGSLDAGKSWTKITGSPMPAAGGGGRGGFGAGAAQGPRGVLPTTPVYDLKIHPRDHEIVLGTHGRGIWIADISALEELTPATMAAEATLLSVQPVIKWNNTGRAETASANFAGQSRLPGVAINYVLKSAATGDVTVRVYDGARMISEMNGTKNAGLNAVRWNLTGQREAGAADAAGGRGGRGGRGGAPAASGSVTYSVDPGEYRVVLNVNGREYTQRAFVLADPGK